jgi:hypothetical protein
MTFGGRFGVSAWTDIPGHKAKASSVSRRSVVMADSSARNWVAESL